MGGLIPIHFQNLNIWSKALPDNSSLVFFYDDNKFRKCPQRNGQAQAYLKVSDDCFALGGNSAPCFIINKTKTSCFARLNTTTYGYDFPTDTDVQRNGDNLFFHGLGTGNGTFAADVIEVFGINTN